MRAPLLCVLALLLAAAPLHARPLTEDEQTSLNQTRDRFLEAITQGRHDQFVEVMPPRIISFIIEGSGIPRDALLQQMTETFATVMELTQFHEMAMVTEGVDAEDARDENGEAFVWGFAPTTTDLSVQGQRLKVEGSTFVLLEKGKWYLVRAADTQQILILRMTYPFLQQVEFPGATKPAIVE